MGNEDEKWYVTLNLSKNNKCLHCRKHLTKEVVLVYNNCIPAKNDDNSNNDNNNIIILNHAFHINCTLKLKDLIYNLGMKAEIVNQNYFPVRLLHTMREFQNFMKANIKIIKYHNSGFDWVFPNNHNNEFLGLLDRIHLVDKSLDPHTIMA